MRPVTAGEQRVDVGAEVAVGRDHHFGAAAARGDVVDREAVADVDHLVARPGEGLRGEVEQLVRAGAADDPRRVDPVHRADRRAQLGRVRIGIAIGAPTASARAASAAGLVPSGFSLAESLTSSRPSAPVLRPGT